MDRTSSRQQQSSSSSKPANAIGKSILDRLNVYKHLECTSAVPAFQTNEPLYVKQPVLNHIRLKKKQEKELVCLREQKQQRQLPQEQKNAGKQASVYDIWLEKPKTEIGDVFVDYAEDLEKIRLATLFKQCQKSKPNPKLLQKPSLLPACEPADPGCSYNPREEDHLELLLKVAGNKKAEIKAKKRLQKKLKTTRDPNLNLEEEFTREMMQGLKFADQEQGDQNMDKEEAEAEDDEESGPTQYLPGDLKRRKSKKQARHERLVKRYKSAARRRKHGKLFDAEFFKIRQYLRQFSEKQKLMKEHKREREARKVEKLYQPAKLGKQSYIEPDLEFNLRQELSGSLRKMNTDGNLLMDRFKSFQRRNLIEHRQVQKMTQAKIKRKRIVNQAIYNKDLFERKTNLAQ